MVGAGQWFQKLVNIFIILNLQNTNQLSQSRIVTDIDIMPIVAALVFRIRHFGKLLHTAVDTMLSPIDLDTIKIIEFIPAFFVIGVNNQWPGSNNARLTFLAGSLYINEHISFAKLMDTVVIFLHKKTVVFQTFLNLR